MFDALPPGAAIFGDYRTLHRGTANRSPEPRPLLMHVYGREWWSDAVNYGVSLKHSLCMLCHVSTDGLTVLWREPSAPALCPLELCSQGQDVAA